MIQTKKECKRIVLTNFAITIIVIISYIISMYVFAITYSMYFPEDTFVEYDNNHIYSFAHYMFNTLYLIIAHVLLIMCLVDIYENDAEFLRKKLRLYKKR